MGNINSYMKDNKEILTSGNYNEMDALVFSELSYIKFETVFGEEAYEGKALTIYDYVSKLTESGAVNDLPADQVLFLDTIKGCTRYRECTINNLQSENSESQWAAMTVDIGDGTDTSVVAMRGTDGTTLGWTEDLELAYDLDGTNAQLKSAEYLEQVNASSVFLAGHSKGGNDVISAYMMASGGTRGKVSRIDNFDGPGINPEFGRLYSEGYKELNGKLNNYYPQDSVIGLLLKDNPGNSYFVKADTTGHMENMWIFGEHDPFSWQIGGEASQFAFEESEQSTTSGLINDILDDTLRILTNEERENVINVLVKLGIPGLLAGDSDLYCSEHAEGIRNLAAMVEQNGFIPYHVKKGLKGGLLAVAGILEGVEFYSGLTPGERDAAAKTIDLMIVSAVANLVESKVEDVVDWAADIVEKAVNRVKGVYDTLASVISDAAQGIADKLFEWGSKVVHGAEELADKFSSIFEGAADWLFRWGKGGERISASFQVEVQSLRKTGVQLQEMAVELERVYDTVQQIRGSMSLLSNLYNLKNFLSIESSLKKEMASCGKMGNLAKTVADVYDKTEGRIITNNS